MGVGGPPSLSLGRLAELWRVIAWKGAGGRREVEYLILLAEIVESKEWMF